MICVCFNICNIWTLTEWFATEAAKVTYCVYLESFSFRVGLKCSNSDEEPARVYISDVVTGTVMILPAFWLQTEPHGNSINQWRLYIQTKAAIRFRATNLSLWTSRVMHEIKSSMIRRSVMDGQNQQEKAFFFILFWGLWRKPEVRRKLFVVDQNPISYIFIKFPVTSLPSKQRNLIIITRVTKGSGVA